MYIMYAHVHVQVHCTFMLYMYVYVYMHIAYMQNVTTGYGAMAGSKQTLYTVQQLSLVHKREFTLRMGFGSHTHQSGDRE